MTLEEIENRVGMSTLDTVEELVNELRFVAPRTAAFIADRFGELAEKRSAPALVKRLEKAESACSDIDDCISELSGIREDIMDQITAVTDILEE